MGANMKTTETEFSWGASVRLRPVPPYAVLDAYLVLPEPPLPKVVIKSKAGGEEEAPVLPETPEWYEYQDRMAAHRKMTRQAILDYTLQYGIVSWRLPGTEEWVEKPPEDWKEPAITWRYKILGDSLHPFDDRRLRYIKYELIQTQGDADIVDLYTQGMTAPVTKGEIRAALSPFGLETAQEDL